MKQLVILGAGTAGTMVANHVVGELPEDWQVTVVDPAGEHLYQPGLLFLAFGRDRVRPNKRPRAGTLAKGVRWLKKEVETLDTDSKEVVMGDGSRLRWDLLVIASGSDIHPEETEGLAGAVGAHDFYTLEGAQRLHQALEAFEGGRLVVNIVEMPIKCPVAPLEFVFLADDYFTGRGIRDQVELVFATPLDDVFTKPISAKMLSGLIDKKGIKVETEFNAGSVDAEAKILRSWDEREIPYDLLVSIPTHMGAEFIERAGLGDDLRFVPTHPHTLLSRDHDDIFVLGDASNLPTSKAGSVAHFQSEVVATNILRRIAGEALVGSFDGHANCFIESGRGKGLLIDFNYDVEPLPGSYPLPVVGPFSLLKESRRNHLGKLAFRWAYWNLLLPARPVPVPNRMSMVGKRRPAKSTDPLSTSA